jgi:hypothetical protein
MMTTQASFQSICFNIFNEMLNTVPSGVVLSNPIGPRTWITRESHLDLLSSGAVTYSGNITTHSFSASPPAQATYQYNTVGGGNTGPKFSLPDPCMRIFASEIRAAPNFCNSHAAQSCLWNYHRLLLQRYFKQPFNHINHHRNRIYRKYQPQHIHPSLSEFHKCGREPVRPSSSSKQFDFTNHSITPPPPPIFCAKIFGVTNRVFL